MNLIYATFIVWRRQEILQVDWGAHIVPKKIRDGSKYGDSVADLLLSWWRASYVISPEGAKGVARELVSRVLFRHWNHLRALKSRFSILAEMDLSTQPK